MAKLNQIIAIEKGIKSKSYAEMTELHKVAKKPDLFNGFSKTYQPKDDNVDEQLPPERKRVQFSVDELFRSFERNMTALIEVTARKDWTNCIASADVKIDDKALIKAAPVSFLLFMEKQLLDLRTFVDVLPVLDEGETWNKDINSGLYKAEETKTHRTKKVMKPIVLYPATPEHPAQTQMASEDIIAGFWSQVKLSGAMPKPQKMELYSRIDTLLRSIKEARESANMAEEVKQQDIVTAIFNYIRGQ